ncbi:MAG: hypothetical protein AB8G22_01205 [Saprospiraceae bacterium]
MKISTIILFCLIGIVFSSCEKNDFTREVTISFSYAPPQSNLFAYVDASIVFFETDSNALVEFEREFIDRDSGVNLDPTMLNLGNYYVRYQYFVNDFPEGPVRHQPFQVQDREDILIEISD